MRGSLAFYIRSFFWGACVRIGGLFRLFAVHIWRFVGGYSALMESMNKLRENQVFAGCPIVPQSSLAQRVAVLFEYPLLIRMLKLYVPSAAGDVRRFRPFKKV